MRVAILADIHGNLPACEAVLDDVARQSPDYIVAAGDLALRGAHPAETVDLLFSRCHAVLMGNTDCYLAGNYLSGAYRERDHWKRELLDWTRAELGEARTRQLGELPFSVRYSPRRGQDLYICHANPKNLEESLEPTLDEQSLRKYFNNLDAAACAFGHLHFPYRRRLGRMLLADVASVGIPRDGDLRPAYGLFTFLPTGWRVQIRRVRYPVKRATQALLARKVPGGPLLIHKLVEGRYRHHTSLLESARRHSGMPPAPFLRPPPGLAASGPTAPRSSPSTPSSGVTASEISSAAGSSTSRGVDTPSEHTGAGLLLPPPKRVLAPSSHAPSLDSESSAEVLASSSLAVGLGLRLELELGIGLDDTPPGENVVAELSQAIEAAALAEVGQTPASPPPPRSDFTDE